MRPTLYLPLEDRGGGTLLIRTTGDSRALASRLRREISQTRPELHVRNVTLQSSLVRAQMVRERLLAALSGFFAAAALVLAAMGLYGVLHYGVIQRHLEIAIRLALGARAGHVVRGVTTNLLVMVVMGAIIGLSGGLVCGRLVDALLFEVKPTDPGMIVAPLLILAGTAVLAGLRPCAPYGSIPP